MRAKPGQRCLGEFSGVRRDVPLKPGPQLLPAQPLPFILGIDEAFRTQLGEEFEDGRLFVFPMRRVELPKPRSVILWPAVLGDRGDNQIGVFLFFFLTLSLRNLSKYKSLGFVPGDMSPPARPLALLLQFPFVALFLIWDATCCEYPL